jgi:hypothetical protein
VLRDALRKYVNEACPRLSDEERGVFVDELLAMTVDWAGLKAQERSKFLSEATMRIAERFGATPVFLLRLGYSKKRSKSETEAKQHAQVFLDSLKAKIRADLSLRDPKLLASEAADVEIRHVDMQPSNLALVEAHISGTGITERQIRRVGDHVRRRARPGVAVFRVEQLPLFEKAPDESRTLAS